MAQQIKRLFTLIVSSGENKDNLDRQAERLTQYATAKGYQVQHIVKEVGSGLNDNRKKLERLLKQDDYQFLIVEHKDRLGRFGTHYIDVLLNRCDVTLEIVNESENGRDELMEDLVAIITSFAARLYGQRRGKRKTEKIIATLQSKEDDKYTYSLLDLKTVRLRNTVKQVYTKSHILGIVCRAKRIPVGNRRKASRTAYSVRALLRYRVAFR